MKMRTNHAITTFVTPTILQQMEITRLENKAKSQKKARLCLGHRGWPDSFVTYIPTHSKTKSKLRIFVSSSEIQITILSNMHPFAN